MSNAIAFTPNNAQVVMAEAMLVAKSMGRLDHFVAAITTPAIYEGAKPVKVARYESKANVRPQPVKGTPDAVKPTVEPIVADAPTVDAPYGMKSDGSGPRKRPVPTAAIAARKAQREAKSAASTPVKATVAATPVKADKPVVTASPNVKPNYASKLMLSDAGTASKGQVKWLVANAGMTAKAAAKLSMVAASNKRAAITGKA